MLKSLADLQKAAEAFVGHYYQAVNANIAKLDNFYVNSSTKYSTNADISINGAVLASPAEYSKLLESQGSDVSYEVESFDTHVMNPSYQLNAPDNIYEESKVEKNGGRMSVIVTTMGKVQFGRGREAPQKMFNETFVLVPNWEAMTRNAPRGVRKWLIMSQNFRAL